jgi:hypothetical protein
MHKFIFFVLTCGVAAQTAEELVAKNIQAKGGIDKIKAIHSLKMTGKLQQGSLTILLRSDTMAPTFTRQMVTIQGMTQIQAYDGTGGWQINPFQGRKDPERLGEDDTRDLQDDSDFYGPLVDYQSKGNTVEYLGHDTVDGDDAYRLKITLKNGDIFYYFLDPDTYLEIRTEKQEFIRGSVRETFNELGSYKKVNEVYYPFAIESGSKGSPNDRAKITVEKIEANVQIEASEFTMPVAKGK